MKTKLSMRKFEKGQVLPILVVALLVMVMLAALMIDGGMLLSHRRTAQAAADAGALAGAAQLCPGAGDQASASSVAADYVGRNKADVEGITFPDSSTIRVETSVTSQAFFARIFDSLGLTAAASAEANCTLVGGAAVNLPIAFPCLEKEYNGQGEVIGCKNIKTGVLSIIMDSKDTGGYCYDAQDNPDSDVICYDMTSESSRGWLSLDGGDQFKNCWLTGTCVPPSPLIYPPTWLSELAGLSTNDFKTLKNYYGVKFVIPIYDQESETKPDPCPAGDNCILRTGGGLNAYRIIGFTEFIITCIHETGGDQVNLPGGEKGSVCPLRHELCLIPDNGIDGSTSLKSIEGNFTSGIVSFGAGGGEFKGGLYVVQLTK